MFRAASTQRRISLLLAAGLMLGGVSFPGPAHAGGVGAVTQGITQLFGGQVNGANATNGQSLIWQSSTGTWIPGTPSGTPSGPAGSDIGGTYPSSVTVLSLLNVTGGSSHVLDLLGSTRGQVLYRGAAGWTVLSPSTSGFVFTTQGAGADPVWAAGSTVTNLQTAYTGGATIALTAAKPIALSNSVDTGNLLTLTRAFAGGGKALAVTMGATTTGNAIDVTMTNGTTGNAMSVACGGFSPAVTIDSAFGGYHTIGNVSGSTGTIFGWTASATDLTAAADTGICRQGPGIIRVGNGGSGDASGTIQAASETLSSGLTLTGATVTGAPTWSSSQAITLSTAAQPNVTSLGSLTALTMAGTLTLGANTLALASATVSGTPTWSSSQAITLSTAAQPNVTSLGTLTSLTSSGAITAASFLGPVGSAAAPSFSFSGSTNDGMYQTGIGNISFTTSGAVKLLISTTGQLQFQGTTSSFPAIKRNGAALNFRLADDSADAAITASAATLSSGLTLTGATVTGAPTWSSSQAITLSTAAQPNVTSLGSLTALTMAGTLTLGANTLALASATVSGTPTWSSSQAITLSTAAQPSVTSLGTLTSLTSSGALTSGVTGTGTGSLVLKGTTSGSATITVAAAAGTPASWTLPTATGAAGTFLKDAAGDGVLSWATPSAALAGITNGTTGQLAWSTGSGGITHLAGPTDQPFVFVAGKPAGTAAGQAISLTAGAATTTGAGGAASLIAGAGAAGVGGLGTLGGGAGVGTNKASGGLKFDTGASTGTGTSQAVFALAPTSTSGSGSNATATILTLANNAVKVTSGTTNTFNMVGTFSDNGTTSTTVARAMLVNPTVNYSAASATGHYEGITVQAVETALPVPAAGFNYLLRLEAGSAGTTDEMRVTNAGSVQVAPGTSTLPSFTFINETSLGFYYVTAGTWTFVGGVLSSPGAGGTSERFGLGSTSAGSTSSAFGPYAAATAANSVCLGYVTTASGGTDAVSVGNQCNCNGAAVGNIHVGSGGISSSATTPSIVMGYASFDGGFADMVFSNNTTPTADHQLIFGDTASPIYNVFCGNATSNGTRSNTPAGVIHNATWTAAGNTDVSGGNYVITSGMSTGTGATVVAPTLSATAPIAGSYGSVQAQTGYSQATGTAQQTPVDRLYLSGLCKLSATPGTSGTVLNYANLSTVTDANCGATVYYTVDVEDATHHVSSITGQAIVSVSNRNGTPTAAITTAAATNQVISDSTTYTTLACTTTATVSGTNVLLKVTPTWAAGTPTIVRVSYSIMATGNTTVTPQP